MCLGQPIALKGSYTGAVTDGVDIFSGRLENSLPLITVHGRGEVAQGLNLPLRNLEWSVVQTDVSEQPNPYQVYYDYAARLAPRTYWGVEGTVSLLSLSRGGYGVVGKVRAETKRLGTLVWDPVVVTTITFTGNDGSIINFRDDLTDGQPLDANIRGCNIAPWIPPGPLPAACSRGRVFHSTNGENATFVASADVNDQLSYGIMGEQNVRCSVRFRNSLSKQR